MLSHEMSEEKEEAKTPSRDRENVAVTWAKYSHLAMVLPASVFVGWIAGTLLDKVLHWGWLAIAGIVLGACAGFMELIRAAMKIGSEK